MSDDWKSFGMVAGIFWVGRLGITLRYFGPKIERWHDCGMTCWRLWPVAVLWADR